MRFKIKFSILCFFFLVLVFPVFSQNYIGLSPAQIALKIKTEYPQLKLDKNAVNPSYKYLKYVDKITEQTVLFFLSDKNICTYIRWMSDYSNLNDMVGMLNKKYKKSGVNTWSYVENGVSYVIKMEEEEWYFTITFRKN